MPTVDEELARELWVYDAKAFAIDVRGDEGRYQVCLDELTTSARVLDLLMQVSQKTWATDSVLASLLRTVDLLLDPQANLCSWGRERGPIQPEAVIRRKGLVVGEPGKEEREIEN